MTGRWAFPARARAGPARSELRLGVLLVGAALLAACVPDDLGPGSRSATPIDPITGLPNKEVVSAGPVSRPDGTRAHVEIDTLGRVYVDSELVGMAPRSALRPGFSPATDVQLTKDGQVLVDGSAVQPIAVIVVERWIPHFIPIPAPAPQRDHYTYRRDPDRDDLYKPLFPARTAPDPPPARSAWRDSPRKPASYQPALVLHPTPFQHWTTKSRETPPTRDPWWGEPRRQPRR